MEPVVPAGIESLGPEVSRRVVALVTAAEDRQAVEAEQALDQALAIVPKPVRGLVRKVLLG